MCIIESYNDVGTVDDSVYLFNWAARFCSSSRDCDSSVPVLDGPKKANLSHQGLLQAIGHLLVWYEWARNLASLPLWVGVQASSQLRRFVRVL